VAVYKLKRNLKPEYFQALPSTAAPEGLLAIPQRNLFVTSSEADDRTLNLRAGLTIYELQEAEPAYPTVISHEQDGTPIPWGALSGLAGHPTNKNRAYTIYDSFYRASRIFVMDVHKHPTVILQQITSIPKASPKDPMTTGIGSLPKGRGPAPHATCCWK
jgi:hypothetical protein